MTFKRKKGKPYLFDFVIKNNLIRVLKKKRIIIHANLTISLLMAQLMFVSGIDASKKVIFFHFV